MNILIFHRFQARNKKLKSRLYITRSWHITWSSETTLSSLRLYISLIYSVDRLWAILDLTNNLYLLWIDIRKSFPPKLIVGRMLYRGSFTFMSDSWRIRFEFMSISYSEYRIANRVWIFKESVMAHGLTLIVKSWKTHPEIFPKFSISGSWPRPFTWKTHPTFFRNFNFGVVS